MEEMLPHLVEWGVLGLWTVSLMYREHRTEAKHTVEKDRNEERHANQIRELIKMRDQIQRDVLDELQENRSLLNRALDRLDMTLMDLRGSRGSSEDK